MDEEVIPPNLTLKAPSTKARKPKAASAAAAAAAAKVGGGGVEDTTRKGGGKPIYNVAAYVAAGIKPTITSVTGADVATGSHDVDDAIVMKLSVFPPSQQARESLQKSCHAYNDDAYTTFESVVDCESMTAGMSSMSMMPMAASDDAIMRQQFSSPPQKPSLFDESSATSSLKVVKLLQEFEEKSKNNEWPATTHVSCYWCCHKFDNAPLGIPVRFLREKFHVFGCFCSLECATAYNFASHESMDDVWERYALLNLLACKLSPECNSKVRSAPSRLALACFGGHMTIDEFRAFGGKSGRFVNVNCPPMMTLTLQVEEINDSDVRMEHKYVPIDSDRVNKYKEKVMLRRTKPLVGSQKNTLDCTMNIRCERG